MRAASTAAQTSYNSGGSMKVRGPRAKAVTLPTLVNFSRALSPGFRANAPSGSGLTAFAVGNRLKCRWCGSLRVSMMFKSASNVRRSRVRRSNSNEVFTVPIRSIELN